MSIDTPNNAETGSRGDKITAYGWKFVGDPKPMFCWLPKSVLHIDETYQRAGINQKAIRIAREWSWVGCGVILVAQRGADYYVIDGQHRVSGAKRRADITELPCAVYQTSGPKEEASGFLMANTERKALSAIDKFYAAITAGDPNAIETRALLDDLEIELVASTNRAGQIKCIRTVRRLVEANAAAARRVLWVVRQLSIRQGRHLPERVIDGLFYLDQRLADCDLEDRRLVDRLLAIGMDEIETSIAKAAAFYTKGGARVYADGILTRVNKGLRRQYKLRGGDE
jgi:hypothetical protein